MPLSGIRVHISLAAVPGRPLTDEFYVFRPDQIRTVSGNGAVFGFVDTGHHPYFSFPCFCAPEITAEPVDGLEGPPVDGNQIIVGSNSRERSDGRPAHVVDRQKPMWVQKFVVLEV